MVKVHDRAECDGIDVARRVLEGKIQASWVLNLERRDVE